MPDRRTPPWLWPNLLSLDAPVVAVVWLLMFEKSWRQTLPWGYHVALGLAVWGIYIVDRIIDVKMLAPGDHRLGTRHDFHGRFIRSISVLAVVSLLGALLVAGFHISAGPLLDYGKPVAVMVVVFFSLTIFSKQDREVPHLRNLFAGLAFAYGTSMGAHMYSGKSGFFDLSWLNFPPADLLFAPEMLAFAVLCTLNISSIHFWEHSRSSDDPELAASNDLALTVPLTALGAASIGLAAMDEESSSRPFFYAVLISTALLYVINRNRARFSLDALRVMADAAMIVPFPVFLAMTAQSPAAY